MPSEISTLLGAGPTRAWAKGDSLGGKDGRHVSGLWALEATETAPVDLNAQIQELLAKVTGDLGAWRSLTSRYRVDVFCGWFMDEGNEGETIVPSTLAALGERGIELALDVYAPDDRN